MDTHAVTLELSPSVYRIARQVSDAVGRPVERVLEDSLALALPPLDDVPLAEMDDLAGLALLDDAALWQVARATMAEREQADLEELLDAQAAGELQFDEGSRLKSLMDTYGLMTLRKAHAYLLLARRGYQVPMQDSAN